MINFMVMFMVCDLKNIYVRIDGVFERMMIYILI